MGNRCDEAIPRIGDNPHWPSLSEVFSVPIIESHEELVSLSLVPERILVRSAYYEAGIVGSKPECYAREQVFDKLLYASSLLPSDIRMVVLDGWRSPVVQKDLFERCCMAISREQPSASKEEISVLAQQYVALPSTKLTAPSPHLTGGAIDVTLATREGRLLNFGAAFDYPHEVSYARAFEELLERQGGVKEGLSIKDRQSLENRRLLYSVMAEAGFVNYSYEWWHFEYGTQRWALRQGHDYAIYGPTKVSFGPYVDSPEGEW